MNIIESRESLDNNYEGKKRGRKKKEKLESPKENNLANLWDEFYNELKTNTTEDDAIKIFAILNFMIILKEIKKEFISIYNKNQLNLGLLSEEVKKYLYFKNIKINLYENILKDYNLEVSKGSLDEYIKRFLNIINDYENIEKKFKVYVLKKYYSIMNNEVKVTYNLIKFIRELIKNVEFKSIYDPAIGTGNLISEVIKSHDVDIIEGQDIREFEVNFTKMHLILSEKDSSVNNIYVGNSIINPMNVLEGGLKKFDCIVCNPPSNGEWGATVIKENDKYNRFYRGIPPKHLPGFAYITHIVESLSETGVGVVVVPQGVLFRDGSEEAIRRQLIEEGVVDTVIYLPQNMMEGNNNPVNIIILNKAKRTRDVFIIDLTGYGTTENGKTVFSEDFIREIASVYERKIKIDNMSDMTQFNKLKENDFNLYNKMYVSRELDVVEYDFNEIADAVVKIKEELADLNRELNKIMMM